MARNKGKGKASQYDSGSQPEDSDEDEVVTRRAKKARLTSSATITPTPHKSSSSSTHARPGTPFVNPFVKIADLARQSEGGDKGAKGGRSRASSGLAQLAAASSSGHGGGKDSTGESDPEGVGRPADYTGGGAAALFSAKKMGDQFANLRKKMEDVSRDVHKHDASIEEIKHQLNAAIGEMESLDRSMKKAIKDKRTMLDGIVNHEERMSAVEKRLEVLLQAREQDDRGPATVVETEGPVKIKGEKERDNSLQDAVRKCLSCMMGIAFGAPLPKPLDGGTFWVRVHEPDEPVGGSGSAMTEGTWASYLRPDWERPWTDNQFGWSMRATTRIQRHGNEYTSALTTEHLATLSRDTIVDAIRVVFLSMAKRWKLESTAKGGEVKTVRNNYAKNSNRKRAKAKARAAVCAKVPGAQSQEFAYQLQWQYQSSDESEVETFIPVTNALAVDPDTDNDGDSKPKEIMTRKIWVSHAPAWRLETTNQILDDLDVHVAKERKKEKVGRGNTFRDRRRGEPRTYNNTTLPKLKSGKKDQAIRIPRTMINPAWLNGEFGIAYDLRALIADNEPGVEAGAEPGSESGSAEGDREEVGRGDIDAAAERDGDEGLATQGGAATGEIQEGEEDGGVVEDRDEELEYA